MASKTKIYIVLEFVTGGELFDKIVRKSLLQFFSCCCHMLDVQKQKNVELYAFVFVPGCKRSAERR